MTGRKYQYSSDDPDCIYALNAAYRDKKAAFIVPSHVKTLGSIAFRNCAATAIVLRDGVEKICGLACALCENLQAVYIPKSVKVIGSDAFKGCGKLTIYCGGEPREGWVSEEPRYEDRYVYTDEDYAFDFHRGGVNMTRVTVDVSSNWNRDKRPVVTNVPREKFMTEFAELLKNNY